MKIKCVKTEKCPICGKDGSIQVFFNKQNKIKYGRVRHYILKDEEGYNPQVRYNFRYYKLENLQQLETLLISLDFQFSTAKAQSKNLGHKTAQEFHDQTSVSLLSGQPKIGFNSKIVAGPMGFEPTTFSLEG
jgi:hypothetical protein